MVLILGVDTVLIKLELRAWLKYTMILTLLSVLSIYLPFILEFLVGLLYAEIVFNLRFYFHFIPSWIRAEMVRRDPVPLILRIGPEIHVRLPPLIDIVTRVVILLGLLWISWDLERISTTVFGSYSDQVEPFLRLFFRNSDEYIKLCLCVDICMLPFSPLLLEIEWGQDIVVVFQDEPVLVDLFDMLYFLHLLD